MNLLAMLGNGLGRLGRGMQNLPNTLGAAAFPVDPAMSAGMDPRQIEQMRRAALMRLGFGISGASANGAGLGSAVLSGLEAGGAPFDQAIATAFTNTQRKRAEDKADARYESERKYTLEQDKLKATERDAERRDTAEWRKTQARLQEKGIGVQAAGLEEDPAKIERQKLVDQQVDNILKRADAEKRGLTTDELRTIQVLRGGSLSSSLGTDLLGTLMMGGGLGAGVGGPAAGPTEADVMGAWRGAGAQGRY